MTSRRSVVPILFLVLIVVVPASARADLVITERMHHLRSGAAREWAEFPERAESTELVLTFNASPTQAGQTLCVRHRDLKQLWRALLNGKEIARLPLDEADVITCWDVPVGTLKARLHRGRELLRRRLRRIFG